jgi:DNA-binding PadR family transcriptional regulator
MELTTLEQAILSAVIALRGDGYGVSIQAKIKETIGREPSIGSIYASLERLERRGLTTSRQGEATAARGGRRKLLFKITGNGQRALAMSLNDAGTLARLAGIQRAPA